jgi:hypothetical protein
VRSGPEVVAMRTGCRCDPTLPRCDLRPGYFRIVAVTSTLT